MAKSAAFEWVDQAAALDDLVARLVDEPVFGIDTEFHRERTYWPQIALVQLSWPTGIALVDPLAVDLAPLARLLTGPGVAIAHAADQDIEVLERACGAIPARLFDTQLAAGFLGLSTPSLANLVERLLRHRLAKGDRISDWTVRPLTADQSSYAASDVAHLLELHAVLRDRLDARGRLGWAEEECERLRVRPRLAQDPDTAWWRVKESRTLRGRSRGIAQTLAAWREREAQAEDRPPRYVLPDLALLAISHRPPATIDELRALRGIDGRHLRGGAARRIMAAIEQGKELTNDEIRVPPVEDFDRALRPAVTLTSAWIAQLSADLEVDAALLATRADLQEFLRGDADARLANGWRHGLVGEPVRELVDGRAALAFDGRGGLRLVPIPDAVDLVTRFIECINRRDVDGLAALMTDDHTLTVFDEPPLRGRDANVDAWRGYFTSFPNYVIRPHAIGGTGAHIAVLGSTTGSHLGLPDEEESRQTLIWVADVVDAGVASWRLVVDTPEHRQRFNV